MERVSISSLKKDKDIIIKASDKGNTIVILDKHNYLSEAYHQLNSQHYVKLDTFDFKDLMYGLNTYFRGMFNRGILDEITFDYLMKGNQNYYGPGLFYRY
jgi:tRNA uridine 5-carbamoylmethylation protein Kti12